MSSDSSLRRVPLLAIAHGRSGDKGDTVNVGVAARHPAFYPILLEQLTTERVAAHFGPLVRGPVERYELPNLSALNFLLHGALDGGGTISLMLDSLGKTYAYALMRLEMDVPDDLLEKTPHG